MTGIHRTRGLLRRLHRDRAGATAIEYALIAALIALALVGSIDRVGDGNAALIQNAADSLNRD